MKDDTISRAAAIQTAERMYERCDTGSIKDYHDLMVEALTALPSVQSELEDKIRAIGYTGKEGRIYIGGRLFAVRELPQ